MKIEIGENLVYSWLKHVKECQIVQTNWKVSSHWTMSNIEIIENIINKTRAYFEKYYKIEIFKDISTQQFIKQAEIDVLGILFEENSMFVYGVEIAFHELGLNYGSKDITVNKIINKLIRMSVCVIGYFNIFHGELVFASPKISDSILNLLSNKIEDLNRIFIELGLNFKFRVISNDDFNSLVLNPILIASEGISDTNELFVRAYQMQNLFTQKTTRLIKNNSNCKNPKNTKLINESTLTLNELKVGRIVQTKFREILLTNVITEEEISKMQNIDYSNDTFGIKYPVLVKEGSIYEKVRYYIKPIKIFDENYYICSQWFNNNKGRLLDWIKDKTK